MGLCGCFGTCDCILQGAGQVSISGSGDVADPYIITGNETPFDLTSLSQALVVTPGGGDGHEPSIDLVIDPASEAPVSVGPAGLKIDCCPSGASEISAVDCNDMRAEVDGLYADSGPTSVDPGGVLTVAAPGAGGVSSDSWSRVVTNNEDCPIIVAVGGNPFFEGVTSNGQNFTIIQASYRLNISGGTFLGGGTQRSSRFSIEISGGDLAAPATLPDIAKLDDWAIIPAGASRTFSSDIGVTRRLNFSSATYEFQTPHILAWRMRREPLDVVGSG